MGKRRLKPLTTKRETEKKKKRDNKSRQLRRSDPDYSQEELDRDNASRQQRMNDPDFLHAYLEQYNSSRHLRRSDTSYSQEELSRDSTTRQLRRSDISYSQEELSRDSTTRQQRRSDPDYYHEELSQDSFTRQLRRSDQHFSQEELSRDNSTRRIKRNEPIPWNVAKETYEASIQDGPFHRCYSCDKLLFESQIRRTTYDKLKHKKECSDEYLGKLILNELIDDEEYIFCTTCMTYINKKTFPRFNINNSNLKFPEIPEEIRKLTALEERCIAARIPFMRIQALGCDRQLGIKSGVINVPIDVRRTIESIPVRPEHSGVIELSLMRRMRYKSYYMKERIRPAAIWEAAGLLCATPLYIQEGIQLNDQWDANGNYSFLCIIQLLFQSFIF